MMGRRRRRERVVLAHAVGKKRNPWRGLLLATVTFGIYRYYWIYKAPTEVHKQFELDREGRDDSVVWLVLGIVLPFLLLVYDWKAVANVRYVRARLGLEGGITPARFTLLPVAIFAVAVVLYVVGELVALAGDPFDEAAMDAAFARASPFLFGAAFAALAALVVNVWTYFAFQRDINEVWDAWSARTAALAAEAAPPANPVATLATAPTSAAQPPPTPPAPAAPAPRTGTRYVCPSCAKAYRLAVLPPPGTVCPACRARAPA